MAHKETITMQYTEIVYYDDNGNEVARVRMHDDHMYDAAREEVTEDEIQDYCLA